MGYRRPDGRVGTRNYVGILSTVNCSATVSRAVAAHFNGSELLKRYNIDGVVALTHKTGCGMTMGEPLRLLRRTLADGGLRLLVRRGRQEWPPLAQAPGVRVDHLSLEDLFLEVAE